MAHPNVIAPFIQRFWYNDFQRQNLKTKTLCKKLKQAFFKWLFYTNTV